MPPLTRARAKQAAPAPLSRSTRPTGGAHTLGRFVGKAARLKPLIGKTAGIKPLLRTGRDVIDTRMRSPYSQPDVINTTTTNHVSGRYCTNARREPLWRQTGHGDIRLPNFRSYIRNSKTSCSPALDVKACSIHRPIGQRQPFTERYYYAGDPSQSLPVHADDKNTNAARESNQTGQSDATDILKAVTAKLFPGGGRRRRSDGDEDDDTLNRVRIDTLHPPPASPEPQQDTHLDKFSDVVNAKLGKLIKQTPSMDRTIKVKDVFLKIKQNLTEAMAPKDDKKESVVKQIENRRKLTNLFSKVQKMNKFQALKLQTERSKEDSDRIIPATDKGQYEFVQRVNRAVFCEPAVVTRPTFFTENMMLADMTREREGMKSFVKDLQLSVGSKSSTAVMSICQINNDIICLQSRFPLNTVPFCSLRIRWRLPHHGQTPSMQMVFILLNRYGRVISLVRVSANSACAVFQKMAGAECVMTYLSPNDGPRLLIGAWWHNKCSSQSFRHSSEATSNSPVDWLHSVRFAKRAEDILEKEDVPNTSQLHARLSVNQDYDHAKHTPSELETTSSVRRRRSTMTTKKQLDSTATYMRSVRGRMARNKRIGSTDLMTTLMDNHRLKLVEESNAEPLA